MPDTLPYLSRLPDGRLFLMHKGSCRVLEDGIWTDPSSINLKGATPLSDDEIRDFISGGLLPDLTDEGSLASALKRQLKTLNLFTKRHKATSALSREPLQRETEAQRSSSARRPTAYTDKEVRTMGNDYVGYPPLDRTALRDGYRMSVRNATRLVADARALMDADRHRIAHLILLLALEELGNALQLYEAGRSGVQDWEAWWRRYFSHPKELESTSLGIARKGDVNERFIREDLMYVTFDEKQKKFTVPPEDEDRELREFVKEEAAYAEDVLTALPPHAFELWEFEEIVKQSPDVALSSVLYARIEELVSREPTVSERDLLRAVAWDLGKSPDDLVAGFEQWKKVAPKARVYVEVVQRLQDRIKKQRETKEGEVTRKG